MEFTFYKMHGLGNDFVFIDDMRRTIELTREQVAFLCDRHFGIGGDGVILVRPSKRPECAGYMHYINSDGTLAQMCGNGVRCFAKFLVDHGYVDAQEGTLIADTLAGPKPIQFEVDADGLMTKATVDMGEPILEPEAVPVSLKANAETKQGVAYVREYAIDSPWAPFSFTCISMGNPHAVTFIDDFDALPDELFKGAPVKSLDTFDVDLVGAYYEKHPAFPEKANIEFACLTDEGIAMRVFERGCGETLACGTGTCATSVAASLTGRAGRENDVMLRGGLLHISWEADNHVMMTGAAATSFSGTIAL